MDDIYIEQSVIGAALRDYTLEAREAMEMLSPDAFTDSGLKAAFNAIKALDNDSDVVDLLTVSDLAGKTVDSKNILAYLGEVAKNAPSSANIKAYAKRLRLLHGKRFAKAKLLEAINMLDERSDNDDVALPVTAALDALSAGENKIRWEYAEDLAKKEVDRMQRVIDNPDTELGLSTGIEGIDTATGRVNRTDLVVIASRPAMGKTELAVTIADAYAVTQNRASLFFTMEMENLQLVQREIALGGDLAVGEMKDPRDLGDDGWAKVTKGFKRLFNKKIAFCDTPNLTLAEIRNLSRKFASRHDRLGGIFIDYLTLMKISDSQQRHVAIADISGGLKCLAKELKMPVFLLSQLNRSLESRPDKRALPSDLRESGAIEQDADIILFPYRDTVYNENTKFKNFVEIGCGKHRHQQATKGWMKFNNGHFYDLADSEHIKLSEIIEANEKPKKPLKNPKDKHDGDGY